MAKNPAVGGIPANENKIINEISFPCVIKPTFLSASRGVIRINTIKELLVNKKDKESSVFEKTVGNNFYVKTLGNVSIKDQILGYIMVTEQANEILTAVDERKNFILRTVLIIAVVIILFSILMAAEVGQSKL